MGRSLLMGAAIGAMLAVGLTGAGTFVYSQKREADVRKGWKLVKVLRTTHELKRGAAIVPGDLAEREVVEAIVTADALGPSDYARVENRKLVVSLKAGAIVFAGDLEAELPIAEQTCLAQETER